MCAEQGGRGFGPSSVSTAGAHTLCMPPCRLVRERPGPCVLGSLTRACSVAGAGLLPRKPCLCLWRFLRLFCPGSGPCRGLLPCLSLFRLLFPFLQVQAYLESGDGRSFEAPFIWPAGDLSNTLFLGTAAPGVGRAGLTANGVIPLRWCVLSPSRSL